MAKISKTKYKNDKHLINQNPKKLLFLLKKNVGRVFELLQTMKKLSIYMWPSELENFHQLHLDVVLKMLKYSHFNSKMNSLKEVN
jgi:hypothetical protein